MSGCVTKLSSKKGGVKTLDAEDSGRRRREDSSVQLRKAKKEESINKRRNTAVGEAGVDAAASPAAASSAASGAAPGADELPSLAGLASYVEACQSSDASVQVCGVRQLRRLLSAEDSLPVRDVLATGVLPRLVALLASTDARVAFEACWAVTNVASTEATGAVVEAGALAPLVAGMMHGDAAIRDQSMWCIGNVAGDRPAFRDAVLATPGAVEHLLLNLRHPESLRLLRNATWTLSNFCRGKPAPPLAAILPLLPALAHLITVEDAAVASDALWGLCFLMDSDEALIAAIVAAPGVLARVVALLGHGELSVAMPALRIVGNVTSSTEAHTQAGIDAGALAALVPLLTSPRRNVRREACWAVSNVAAGSAAQIGAMLATRGLLVAVLETLRGGDWHVRKEAAWIICNTAAAGTPQHVCTIVAGGVIEPLVGVLAVDDARMIVVVLDAMEAILAVEAKFRREGNPAAAMCRFAEQFEEQGAVERLEELQEHASTDVYDKAYALLKKYWQDAEADADDAGAAGGVENAAAPVPVAAAGAKIFAAQPPGAPAAPHFQPQQLARAFDHLGAAPAAPAGTAYSFGSISFS